jgi:zinc protease
VLAQIDAMRSEPVSQEELATAVNYAIGLLPRSFSTPRTAAGTFALDEYTGRPKDFWKTYREKLEAVTPQDVLRVAKDYLHPEKLVTLIVGNATDILAAERGGEALERLAGREGIRRIPLPDPLTLRYATAPK